MCLLCPSLPLCHAALSPGPGVLSAVRGCVRSLVCCPPAGLLLQTHRCRHPGRRLLTVNHIHPSDQVHTSFAELQSGQLKKSSHSCFSITGGNHSPLHLGRPAASALTVCVCVLVDMCVCHSGCQRPDRLWSLCAGWCGAARRALPAGPT